MDPADQNMSEETVGQTGHRQRKLSQRHEPNGNGKALFEDTWMKLPIVIVF